MKAPRNIKPVALAVALAVSTPALALQFEFDNGIRANVDTTLSYAVAIRQGSRDPALFGIANGGTSRSVNEDNGDLNFDKGKPFQNLVRALTEVEVKYRNFGFFGRGVAYYDFDLHDSGKLGPEGRKRLGRQALGLDGFVYGAFEPAGHITRVRAGRQVISWGESTFIGGGINVINPVDVSRLRVPGSDLKDAFLPTTGLWGSVELTKAASLEGFYLTRWDKTRIDPKGSYFSNNDTISDDSDRVIVSFGRRRDDRFPPTNPVPPVIPGLGTAAAALYGPYDPAASVWLRRGPDRNPGQSGQYGVALRYLAHEMNNTEFGVYYMNYHSRTPVVSAIKGRTTSILTGGPLIAPICAAPALAALCSTGSASAFAEYPENIKLTGFSFNTAGPLGIALQGEYSYRPNLPLQIATPELILASLGLPNLITGSTQIPGLPAGGTAAALVPDGTYIRGWTRVKASQAQMTATKLIPNIAAADQLTLVGEVGANWFHNLPTGLKFAGPAVYLPATDLGSTLPAIGAFSKQTDGFLSAFSWGYRLLARLDYANALFGGTLSPRAAFASDVRGVGPNFNQGVRSGSLGISWDYQRKWVVDAQYTSYWGGRTYCGTDVPGASVAGQPASWCSSANPLKDRDFYSFNISYSF
jgi:hypothetical protein